MPGELTRIAQERLTKSQYRRGEKDYSSYERSHSFAPIIDRRSPTGTIFGLKGGDICRWLMGYAVNRPAGTGKTLWAISFYRRIHAYSGDGNNIHMQHR